MRLIADQVLNPAGYGQATGDKLEFVVGYTDTTLNLHDELVGIRKGKVEVVWSILGRGKLK